MSRKQELKRKYAQIFVKTVLVIFAMIVWTILLAGSFTTHWTIGALALIVTIAACFTGFHYFMEEM